MGVSLYRRMLEYTRPYVPKLLLAMVVMVGVSALSGSTAFLVKPILDDIRIFSDKIARDPRQLGLKGALDRRPVGTGTKLPLTPADEPPLSLDYGGWDTGVLPSH